MNFSEYIFYYISFSWLCFYTILSGWSTTSGYAEKMTFFGVGAFWLQRFLGGIRIPYLANNRLEPRIGRDQHIQTYQFKTTNVKIQQLLKCTLISFPLFRWKWPTQVGILETLCWGWELGMLQIHLWIYGPIIIPFNMTLSEWILKVMWERMSEDMSEKMSKNMSERMSEALSEKMSKDISERMSEDMSDRVLTERCEIMSKRYVRKNVRKSVRRYVR